MEYTIANILFVTIALIVVYYIGFVQGFAKSKILEAQDTDFYKDEEPKYYEYDIGDVEKFRSPREMDMRKARLEQVGDYFHVFDEQTDHFLVSGNNLEELQSAMSKLLISKGQYRTAYYFSKEDTKILREASKSE